MTKQELRSLIREEVRKMLKEARDVEKPAVAYYEIFYGKQVLDKGPLKRVGAVVDSMEPDEIQNAGSVYVVKQGKYTIYVVTEKKQIDRAKYYWCVVTPFDKELADIETSNQDYMVGKATNDVYDLCMKAIQSIKPGTTKEITFQELLKK